MLKKRSPRESKSRAWFFVWIYIALILISLPLTPDLRNLLTNIFSIEFLVNGSLLLFLGILISLVTTLRKRSRVCMVPYFLIWAGLMLGLLMLIPIAVERVHIPEYGLLSILFFRAFRISRKNAWDAYRLSLLWAIVAGILDEFIQYLLPNRYFALRDIGLNTLGALVGLLSYRFYEWVRKRTA